LAQRHVAVREARKMVTFFGIPSGFSKSALSSSSKMVPKTPLYNDIQKLDSLPCEKRLQPRPPIIREMAAASYRLPLAAT
jgi:hypothetical protein